MLNKNPLWHYFLVLGLVLLCLIYALPNLYPEDPALNISASRGGVVQTQTVQLVQQHLADADVPVKASSLENGRLQLRFTSAEQQLKAKELLSAALGQGYITALDLAAATPAWLAGLGAQPMNLGLDLRGGMHFLMAVDTQAAVEKQLNDLAQTLRAEFREDGIRYRSIGLPAPGQTLQIQLRNEADFNAATAALGKYRSSIQLTEKANDLSLSIRFNDNKLKTIREEALAQNITILRNRVNEIGVAEPLVQRQGADRIVVQLPGVQDTAKAKEILGATASLEFRLVDETADSTGIAVNAERYQSRDGQSVMLEKRVVLTGEHIATASSGYDDYGRPKVIIKLDAIGGDKMSATTKDAVGRRMAAVFIEYKPSDTRNADGTAVLVKQQEVISDARIQSRLGRDFEITGLSSPGEAQNLATLLRAGALIAPVQIIEERTLGPSLGQENIELGMQAIAVGLAVVLTFMLVYYNAFGLVANIALLVNLILIVGVMSMIPGATLTLPGMAGIVLTVGMAVDANVLIFERIREELAEGRSVQQAIHLGYDRAFATIADSNITTLLVALVLFSVGTGPVKGFAVTLAIGILTSIFTAVLVSRVLVNLCWGGRRLSSLPI